MPFADSAKAQDKSAAMLRCSGLIRMSNDARIEQRRRFERIFVEKIGSDQAALRLVEWSMRFESILHFGGALFKNLEEVSVTTFKVFENLAQLL